MWNTKLFASSSKAKEFSQQEFYYEKNSEGSQIAREEGNKIFQQKNHSKIIHEEILIKYSKSIALAPNCSKELALAYGNRSCLLFHLGKYQESIIDINYALQINVDESNELFKQKILCRKISSLKLMNDDSEAQKTFDEAKILLDKIDDDLMKIKCLKNLNDAINLKPSKHAKPTESIRNTINYSLPYVSKAITLQFDEQFGVHLVAKEDIKTGEILMVDKAYCRIPELDKIYIVCSHCLKQIWNLIPCNSCPLFMYCSEECKSESWKQYHDVECLIYPKIVTKMNRRSVVFLTRLFIQAFKEIGVEKLIQIYELGELNRKNKNNFNESEILADCNTYKFCSYLLEHTNSDKLDDLKKISELEIKEDYPSFLLSTLKNSTFFANNNIIAQNEEKLQIILIKLLEKCSVNNFDFETPVSDKLEDLIKERTNITFGAVLNSISCFYNHSCCPNVESISLEGPRMLFYSIRPIKKNEQLYHTYGPLFVDDITDRKLFLENKYKFSCKCIACKENWPSDLLNYNVFNDIEEEKLRKLKDQLAANDLLFVLNKNTFNLWINNKNAIESVSKFINIVYSIFTTFEAAVVCGPYATIFYLLFHKAYGSNFEIPEDCKK